MNIRLKGIVFEDFINYKTPAMILEFPFCDFKCGNDVCHNVSLVKFPTISRSMNQIIDMFLENPITEAIVMQGLEPLHPDSRQEVLEFAKLYRERTTKDLVIYTGYEMEELETFKEFLDLKEIGNIVFKVGRFKPDMTANCIVDPVIGVKLGSSNQYGVKY